ncbi:LysM peptidoglycan-binding domain-containing protein [Streptomyces sp. NBC_01275]|uniref:LysM peptidoglycan-binding domain-containing protein n=1 Tax=Streptomyces sp. NBC_01275 TaxID=2903807 RepID=UPI002259B414|nr:transglycosylase family protein [Streptomyces sp. NBC_01275]MCX4762672.1 LysM peptidoglycan-binding domain-containing protein [Streptomyces sp. NBC_01275]
MLSGNGRHRRPRQAPALLVAAGVTGTAIAIPLLAASGASAADGTVWDKVAQCETGGSWSADKGDGYFGGLHLSQDDWETYGGLDYASSPDLASRNQQIAVAQKLLADEGVGAWPTCGLTTGLTKESGALNVDTGVAGDSSDSSSSSGLSDLSRGLSGSSGSSGSSSSSGSSDADSGSTGSTDSSDSSDSSGDSSSSSSSSSSSPSSSASDDSTGSDASGGQGDSQDSGSSSTKTPEAGDSDDSDKSAQDAGSWSLVDTGTLDVGTLGADTLDTGSGRHRGDTADESAAGDATAGVSDGPATASTGRHAAATYVVQEGDSLASIADSLDLDGGWRALYAENRDRIGADPSDIVAGQTLDTGVE